MKAIPLPPITEEVIREVRDRIVEAVHPEQIWLFGSAARGETRDVPLPAGRGEVPEGFHRPSR